MAKKRNNEMPKHNQPAFEHLADYDTDQDIISGNTLSGQAVKEFIHRRRRQLIIHSIIYYRFDDNIISDHQWQAWADELAQVQRQYPDCCAIGFYDKDFKNWTGASGYDLDLYTLEAAARGILNAYHAEKVA